MKEEGGRGQGVLSDKLHHGYRSSCLCCSLVPYPKRWQSMVTRISKADSRWSSLVVRSTWSSACMSKRVKTQKVKKIQKSKRVRG